MGVMLDFAQKMVYVFKKTPIESVGKFSRVIFQQKILESGDNEILHTITFPATNGWEDWVTFNNFPKINLEMGEIKIVVIIH